jgi:hypothetical protein
MSKSVCFFLLLAFQWLLSCNPYDRIPADVIGKEKMGRILFEIGMAEGHMETYYFSDSSRNRDSLLKTELEKVLTIHKVSQPEFTRSYAFYQSRPHILKEVVDSMQVHAQRNQQKIFLKRPGLKVE